jgi:hypothetical protein
MRPRIPSLRIATKMRAASESAVSLIRKSARKP